MIEVQNAGIYSSIQDLGRYGYRRYGIPLSGVMDRPSAISANSLLGNKPETAVLEFAHPGPKLFFTKPTIIAISGAGFQVQLNGKEIQTNRSILIESNSTLDLSKAESGMWGYLAVKGGILSDCILESKSYFKGVTRKDRLEKSDILEIATLSESSTQEVNWGEVAPPLTYSNQIEVYEGPEFHKLTEVIKMKLFDLTLKVSPQSNRMAYLLNHSTSISAKEITTAPVQPGTVQLTPSGKLIVLMRDAQTTGGYSRILQLTEKACINLAQTRPGEKIRFNLI